MVHIEIVDKSTGNWGHINFDNFEMTDNKEHYISQDKNISEDQEVKLYSTDDYEYSGKELKTIGMPVGGIGAGATLCERRRISWVLVAC